MTCRRRLGGAGLSGGLVGALGGIEDEVPRLGVLDPFRRPVLHDLRVMGGLRVLRLRGGYGTGQQGQEQERGDDERELARTHRCDLS